MESFDTDMTARFYPEKAAGGFTAVDGTIEFYTRVNALVGPAMHVLDFGAGRGEWFEEQDRSFSTKLRRLKGKVERVVACDIDPIVLENRTADMTVAIESSDHLPFVDNEFDMIIADYVFEHLDDPVTTANEFDRILQPGGWICARTPNRIGYISLITRLVPNSRHTAALAWVQPGRQKGDVFPTRFRANTPRDIRRMFPEPLYSHYTYFHQAEPAYFFENAVVFAVLKTINSWMPSRLRSNMFVFVQKRQTAIDRTPRG